MALLDLLSSPARRLIEHVPGLLPVGATAPDWHLRGHDGTPHQPVRGRYSVLVFYPMDDTPGCSRQLHEFEAHRERLDVLGADVYGVNPAPAASHRAFVEKCGFGFPILVDPGGAVARHFRALVPFPGFPYVIRTVYAIARDGRVAFARRGYPPPGDIARLLAP